MNFMPAFRYRLRDMAKAVGIFAGVLVLIQLFSTVSITLVAGGKDLGGTATGYSIASVIFVFVVGICTPREQLRLCIQNGVSRRTAFWADAAAFACWSLALAVFGEVLLAVSRALLSGGEKLSFNDLYEILYVSYATTHLSFGQHLESILFSFVSMLAAAAFGAFLSLMFFRLNKGWTIAVAAGVPLLFTFGLPMLMMVPQVFRLTEKVMVSLFTWLARGVWNYALFCGIGIVLFGAIDRLLGKRAPIRGIKA